MLMNRGSTESWWCFHCETGWFQSIILWLGAALSRLPTKPSGVWNALKVLWLLGIWTLTEPLMWFASRKNEWHSREHIWYGSKWLETPKNEWFSTRRQPILWVHDPQLHSSQSSSHVKGQRLPHWRLLLTSLMSLIENHLVVPSLDIFLQCLVAHHLLVGHP